MPSVTLPSRSRVFELLAVGLVSIVVIVLYGFDAALNRDAAVFIYGGSRVADGVAPYVGIFNSVGPLADLVPAIGIGLGQIFGIDDPVFAVRLLFTALTAACGVLIYVLAQQVFRSRAAAFVAPAVLLTFRTFVILGAGGPREKTVMVLFLIAELIFIVRQRWLAAGACTALATLTWQPVFLPAVVSALVGLAAVRDGRLRAAGAFVLGGVIPSAITVVYFASQHALQEAFDGFLFINLEDTEQASLIGDPDVVLPLLTHDYGWALWLIVAGLVSLVVLAVLAVRRRPVDVNIVVLGAGGITAVIWTSFVINGAPDLFVVLPFAALGVAGSVAAVAARLSRRQGWILAGVVTFAATVAATVHAATWDRDGDPSLDEQRANVDAVLVAAPGSSVVSFNAPQVLVLSGRTNPSSYQIFDRAKVRYMDSGGYPGGSKGYAKWVNRHHPDLIVTRSEVLPAWARSVLDAEYEFAGTGPNWSWYVARSAGPEFAAKIRDANASTMVPGAGGE